MRPAILYRGAYFCFCRCWSAHQFPLFRRNLPGTADVAGPAGPLDLGCPVLATQCESASRLSALSFYTRGIEARHYAAEKR